MIEISSWFKFWLLLILPFVVICIFFLCSSALAAPEYSNRMNVTLSNGQTYDVYFSNTLAEKSFSLDKDTGVPLNYTSTAITGYILNSDGSTKAILQFPSFGQTLTYRVQGSTSTTTGLRITKLNDSEGIIFYGHKDSFYWIPVSVLVFGLGLLFCRRKN